ncbi:DUF7269 family protein [Halomarina ordinaria]|uniref:Uncharacterized protein n=1 Tax=Halomarina ordinaria TaxID=3033939 RepID=A0ABD5U897_9EURY|nr:hypothetical protein [Halomarina sp. PSRA2]
MMRRLALLGALLALSGLTLAAVPSVAIGLPLPGTAVLALGALALLAGVSGAMARRSRPEPPALPVPERRRSATVPGADFDDRLANATIHAAVGGVTDRDAIRDHLRTTARAVLARYDGLSPSEADARLADGSWTDDPVAAAFFADELSVDRSLAARLRAVLSEDSAFRRGVHHVVAALDRRASEGR